MPLACLVVVALACSGACGAPLAPTSLVDDFSLHRWSTDDGLPERVVQSVSQDEDGYLWVATFRHVLRFDGMRFVPCGNLGGEIEAGRAEIIVQVLAVGGRRVWLRTTEAVWLLDARGWRRLLAEPPDPDCVAAIRAIADGTGDVIVTTRSRLVRLSPDGGSRPPAPVWPWALFRGRPLEPCGDRYGERPLCTGADTSRVWDLGTWDGATVALTSGGLFRWHGGVWTPVAESPAATGVLLCDPVHGGIWCGGDGGLWFCRDPDGERRWSAVVNGRSPFNVTIRDLTADADGHVWAATDGGLVRLRRRATGFTIIAAPHESPGVNAAWVGGDGMVWAAPDAGGVARLKPDPDASTPVTFEPLRLDGRVDRLRLEAIQVDGDGTVWLGTDGAYLWACRPDRPAQQIIQRGAGRRMSIVSALAARADGGLWIGSGDGLFAMLSDGTIEPPDDPWNPVVPVSAVARARDGIWCATIGSGAIQRDAMGRFRGALDSSCGLPSDTVHTVHEDQSGTVWLGTEAGIARVVDAAGGPRVTTLPPGIDPGPDAVVQIEEDAAGRLWLGTRRGIFVIDPSGGGPPRRLDAGGPLADVACRGRVARAARPEPGHPLAFASDRGLVLVESACEPPAPLPPRVRIEEVCRAGKPVNDAAFRLGGAASDVSLPAGATDVEVRFTALHFADPERPVFRYRLRPPATDRRAEATPWTSVGRDRVVTFRSLPPGRHLFEVSAGVDGAWQERPARVVLDVAPFVWQRPAVVAFAAVAGAAVVAAAAATALKLRYRRQLAREQAVQRERERIARDIHDDLGAGLTQVALLSDIAADDLGDAPAMQRHLARIFRTSRDLASSLDQIVWAVNPGNDSLEKVVSFIGEFAQDFLTSAHVRCRLDLPADVPVLKVGAAARHHLCMVLKEALNNAVRHSGATEVTVGVEVRVGRLTLTVRDDGRGFEPAAVPTDRAGRRHGLDDMRRRMEEVGGTLRVVPATAGTIVTAEVEI